MIIKKNHGEYVVLYMKNISRAKIQLTIKFNQKIRFLRCRKEKILSKHLQFKSSHLVSFDNTNITHMDSSALYKFHLSTLNSEIKDICITIHRLNKEIQFNERKIKQIIAQDIYKHVFFFRI